MYIKFDFEKFERSRVITSQTLGGLDVLDVLVHLLNKSSI